MDETTLKVEGVVIDNVHPRLYKCGLTSDTGWRCKEERPGLAASLHDRVDH